MSSIVYNVVGKTAPPQNVSGFSVSIIDELGSFKWDLPVDTDLLNTGTIEIRYSVDDTDWTQANKLAGFGCGATNSTESIQEGYYFAKFLDDTGTYSQTQATTSVSRIGRSALNTLSEEDLIAKMFLVDSLNSFDNVNNFDLIIGATDSILYPNMVFDALNGWFELNVGSQLFGFDSIISLDDVLNIDKFENDPTLNQGFIYTPIMDLGYVKTVRVYVDSDFDVVNLLLNFDDRQTLMDSWDDFQNYGSGASSKGISIRHFASFTKDDPNDTGAIWTEYEPILFGDFDCRAIKMMIEVSTTDSSNQIHLYSTTATFSVRDIYEMENSTTINGATTTIDFINEFSVPPNLVLSYNQADLVSSRIAYDNITTTGFDVWILNNYGQKIAHDFSYFAKGY